MLGFSRFYGSMHANIGGQDFHDRPVILLRFIGDAFQGIDSTEAELHPRVSLVVSGAELVDGLGEAVGDLALLRYLKSVRLVLLGISLGLLSGLEVGPSEVNSDQYRNSAQSLNDRRYDLNPIGAEIVRQCDAVFGFEPVLGRLDWSRPEKAREGCDAGCEPAEDNQ